MVNSSAGETEGKGRAKAGRGLPRAAVALTCVVLFQLLFASVFLGRAAPPGAAPRAGRGGRRLAGGERGQPARRRRDPADPGADRAGGPGGDPGRAGLRGRRGRPRGESLLIQTAASPGTASLLTKGFAAAAAALKIPLTVRDLAPLPASDPTGGSAYFLIAGWVLGGYVGATVLGLATGGMRSGSLRQAAGRVGWLAGYAAASGLAGALLFGPALGVMSGFSAALAGVGVLVVFAAAAATAALQSALGLPGTLIAIIGMVVFGNPTAGQSIATPLLAAPWNVIGTLLPPGGPGLSSARSVIYLGGVNLTGPLSVLLGYAAGGALLVLAAAAWRKRRRTASKAAPAAAPPPRPPPRPPPAGARRDEATERCGGPRGGPAQQAYQQRRGGSDPRRDPGDPGRDGFRGP